MASDLDSVVGVRFATADDMPYIIDTWRESYWKLKMQGGPVDFKTYRAGQTALIHQLLERSKVELVYSRDVPTEIVGWSAVSGRAVHFVYVKAAYRRRGIARGLLIGAPGIFSHDTPPARTLAKRLGFKVDPYAVYRDLVPSPEGSK